MADQGKPTGKRERVDTSPTGAGGARNVRRDSKGPFTDDQVAVGKTLAADRRQKAKATAPKGNGPKRRRRKATPRQPMQRSRGNRQLVGSLRPRLLSHVGTRYATGQPNGYAAVIEPLVRRGAECWSQQSLSPAIEERILRVDRASRPEGKITDI